MISRAFEFPLFAALALLTAVGCGAGTYESRLKGNTVPYFEYQQTLDENLASEWSRSGIRIRVPKQFQRIPGPETADSPENGEVQTPVSEGDPRQPEYMNERLPGLVAAWRAEVDVLDAHYKAPAFIYVLSNYSMWQEETADSDAALEFNDRAAEAVASGLGVGLPAAGQWLLEKYPRGQGAGYVVEKKYLTARLQATARLRVLLSSGQEDESGDGDQEETARRATVLPRDVPIDGKVCLYEVGDIRVTVVFIVPRQVAGGERLALDSPSSRVGLCLETLSVSAETPNGRRESTQRGPDF